MDSEAGVSLRTPLEFPIEVARSGDVPHILAGGIPVTPINTALRHRADFMGATRSSIDTFLRAALLYVEFCAHLGLSLLDVTNEKFCLFKSGLLGNKFKDRNGDYVGLKGRRGKRTADLMLALLYSTAADIEAQYDVRFDWRRYGPVPTEVVDWIRSLGGRRKLAGISRVHKIKYSTPKKLGLPDAQFNKLLRQTYERWGKAIPDGDLSFSENPEGQRGALFFRNLAILLILRYAGSRRSEISTIRLCDIDRVNSKLHLVTKGHGGERLPVYLHPFVEQAVFLYVTGFRPVVNSKAERGRGCFPKPQLAELWPGFNCSVNS